MSHCTFHIDRVRFNSGCKQRDILLCEGVILLLSLVTRCSESLYLLCHFGCLPLNSSEGRVQRVGREIGAVGRLCCCC